MSEILEWLKQPSLKGECYDKFFIELKDRTHMKVENVESQLIRDVFFILESKSFGSIMINVNDIKAIYTNLLVCESYDSYERKEKNFEIEKSLEVDKLRLSINNIPKVSRIS